MTPQLESLAAIARASRATAMDEVLGAKLRSGAIYGSLGALAIMAVLVVILIATAKKPKDEDEGKQSSSTPPAAPPGVLIE